MIGYRFLSLAEEEMSEAAVFYDAAFVGLGTDFLEDLTRTIDTARTHPMIRLIVVSLPSTRVAMSNTGRFPNLECLLLTCTVSA